MGQAFLKGQGGGGSSSVDLEVVIGDSLPTGQSGMVFVETLTPYQTVFFDSKSPLNFVDGDIYIETDRSGESFVEIFSSDSNTQVTIYLTSALQVVDGNFVSVNAYVFTDSWVQFSFDIPDGKTVTPVDSVAIWGMCTRMDSATPVDLSGMTIEQVIADVEILKVLFNSNNANNYMLRSTEVIQPAVLSSSVAETAIETSQHYYINPIMTSDTTPSGIVTYSRQLNNDYAGYMAFNLNNFFVVASLGSATPEDFVGYEFSQSVWFSSFSMKNPNPEVQISNLEFFENNEWKLVGSVTLNNASGKFNLSAHSLVSKFRVRSGNNKLRMQALFGKGLKIT